jgi:hypothetical protein
MHRYPDDRGNRRFRSINPKQLDRFRDRFSIQAPLEAASYSGSRHHEIRANLNRVITVLQPYAQSSGPFHSRADLETAISLAQFYLARAGRVDKLKWITLWVCSLKLTGLTLARAEEWHEQREWKAAAAAVLEGLTPLQVADVLRSALARSVSNRDLYIGRKKRRR